MTTPAEAFAADLGLATAWEDADRRPHHVSEDALRAILAALGFPADSERALAGSRERLRAERASPPPLITADAGAAIPLAAAGLSPGPAALVLEDGTRRSVTIAATAGGASLPPIAEIGYHRLEAGDRALTLAVAPPRCTAIADIAPGRRLWGAAVQIAALGDGRDEPFGDFRALGEAVRAFARHGADALAISPVHALFPTDPRRFSPYSPSSRLFLNLLYADPEDEGGAVPAGPLIDWGAAIPDRLRRLHTAHDRAPPEERQASAAFREKGGAALEGHLRFDALHAHFLGRTGATGWRQWPAEFHDPAGAAVTRFAAEQATTLDRLAWLQWRADRDLGRAQAAARSAGMAIGLIADLAVGVDPGGSDGWRCGEALLSGLSIGAPPDPLGPAGQSWGITGFSPFALVRQGFAPFIATLRAALRHAGGVRIDHALGLSRLWVVPEGASAVDGAYLAMPEADLLRLIALESQRAGAIVIGEDLGTVPPGFRATMQERGLMGMRVLPFERDEAGAFTPAAAWPAEAVAMTGTHDTATVAGWWKGVDIGWAEKLGRLGQETSGEAQARRAGERAALWSAFAQAGVTAGDPPPPSAPEPAVDAAAGFVAATPAALAILPAEDLLGIEEQPNLPGTVDEHPNWRRRLPGETAALLSAPAPARRTAALRKARPA